MRWRNARNFGVYFFESYNLYVYDLRKDYGNIRLEKFFLSVFVYDKEWEKCMCARKNVYLKKILKNDFYL